ncbi:hypothetical protein MKW98_019883 [Papaver atlanticum]|uniref:Uncharacterized protein n=1 Tax=Papaver atlanticum TaxID=357466 RepID=A0AAD4S0T0_9MAGN|nr:hypothetical protein MKW98_019883 [Papaver atlanticum]
MEARFRMSDPVHGLAGIAETLSKQLDNHTSELAFVNKQIQFHRRHSVARSDEAKGASSSELKAVQSPSLEEDGSSILTDIEQFQ